MSTTVLIRKSSGEILKISLKGQSFSDADVRYWEELVDPQIDGLQLLIDNLELAKAGEDPVEIEAAKKALIEFTYQRVYNNDGTLGEKLREVGKTLYYDPGVPKIRLATQGEIDIFQSSQIDDENDEDAERAKELFEIHPQFRKLMIAYSDIIKEELNYIRQWVMQFKAEVAVTTSLTDLKSRIAGMSNLPDRNLNQLKQNIKNRIDKND